MFHRLGAPYPAGARPDAYPGRPVSRPGATEGQTKQTGETTNVTRGYRGQLQVCLKVLALMPKDGSVIVLRNVSFWIGSVRFGAVRFEQVRFSSVRFGSGWSGPVLVFGVDAQRRKHDCSDFFRGSFRFVSSRFVSIRFGSVRSRSVPLR